MSANENEILIHADGFCFAVDVDKTARYYENHTLCGCSPCRNYQRQIADMLPSARRWLKQFGVDITRPDETSWLQNDDGTVDYLFAGYTVCGKIEKYGKYEFDFKDKIFTSAVAVNPEENGGYFPNEQQGEYFGIIFYDITLPWVLDEPLPEEEAAKTGLPKTQKPQGVLNKIKSIFKKRK